MEGLKQTATFASKWPKRNQSNAHTILAASVYCVYGCVERGHDSIISVPAHADG